MAVTDTPLSRDLFSFLIASIFSTAPSTSFVPHRIYRLFKCSHRWKGPLRPTSLAVAGFRFLRLRDVFVGRALDPHHRLHWTTRTSSCAFLNVENLNRAFRAGETPAFALALRVSRVRARLCQPCAVQTSFVCTTYHLLVAEGRAPLADGATPRARRA